MEDTLTKGYITEQKCILKLMEEGLIPSIPVMPTRYDLLVEINHKIIKIQIKTSRWKNESKDSFIFSCRSCHSISSGNKFMPYTKNDIDYFMTEKDNVFYLIPISDVGTSEKTLRMTLPKSGCKTGFSLAKDYIFEEVIKTI